MEEEKKYWKIYEKYFKRKEAEKIPISRRR